jgi:beta-phosphoglucomutase
MAGPIRAVLFDFDGVIVHSEPLHYQAFRDTASAANLKLTEQEYYGELIGFDDRGAWQRLLEMNRRTLPAADLARLQSDKSELVRDLIRKRQYHALPGSADFIRTLRCPKAICSGALREEIESMLDGIGLSEEFPVIVAAEDVDVGKPDPRGYELAMRLLAEHSGRPLSPGECLVVEDAPTVIARVRRAGFQTLGVTTSYPAEALFRADTVVDSLEAANVAEVLGRVS